MKHIVWINSDPFDNLGSPTWLFTTQELRKSGWLVSLIAPGEPGLQNKLGVEYLGIPIPRIYLIRQLIYQIRVLRYITHHLPPVDVYLFHEMSLPILSLIRLCRRLFGQKRPLYVLDIRSVPMQPAETSDWKDRLRSQYFYLVNWLANRGAVDGRVTITRPMARVLKIPPSLLWGIWTSGVQLECFSKAPLYRAWDEARERVKFIYIGSLAKGRNLDVFARAVIKANRLGMRFSLFCVGEGDNVRDLIALGEESDGYVAVYPAVPHDQIQEWLAKAHIGVLPFPDEEKFRVSSPIKLFEYMAAGMPVLTTRIECHTSVLQNEGNAFWAEESTVDAFIECLKQVWNQRDALPAMGKISDKEAQKWTWAESAANLGKALDYGLRHNE